METVDDAGADAPSELRGSVILDVEPTSCSMRLGHTRDPKFVGRDSLSMDVRIPWRISIDAADGRSLKEAEWSLTLYDGGTGSPFAEEHNAVGQIDYLGEFTSEYDLDHFPESCAAYVMLDESKFALLRDMAREGRLPVAFRLHVKGMNYGYAPDGSSKVWDIARQPNVVITEVETIVPLVEPPEPAETDSAPERAESKPDSAELVAARATTKAIEQLNTRLGWVVFLLAATAAAVIFR